MKLRFTTLQGEPLTVTVTRAEYAQLLERFTVKGAKRIVECPFCERYVPRDEACTAEHGCPLYYCVNTVPGLNSACSALDNLWARSGAALRAELATLRNFRRFLRRAADRGAK